MILVTSRESWQAKHQALVESPLCEIRFAEMMCLGGNGDLTSESLEILFNQAFLVRGLTRPSMLLPCLVAFIGLPGWGSHSCQEMAWPDGLNAMARGF